MAELPGAILASGRVLKRRLGTRTMGASAEVRASLSRAGPADGNLFPVGPTCLVNGVKWKLLVHALKRFSSVLLDDRFQRLVDPGQYFRSQLAHDLEGTQIFLELLPPRGAHNDRGDTGVAGYPGYSHLAHAAAKARGDRFKPADDSWDIILKTAVERNSKA